MTLMKGFPQPSSGVGDLELGTVAMHGMTFS